jgi:hypothetical protein
MMGMICLRITGRVAKILWAGWDLRCRVGPLRPLYLQDVPLDFALALSLVVCAWVGPAVCHTLTVADLAYFSEVERRVVLTPLLVYSAMELGLRGSARWVRGRHDDCGAFS